jgi:predicted nucleic acid-binding Zn ribbon protein
MSDEPVAACQECREPVERVFHPVAVHFKGSGFYSTDYGRGRSGASTDSGNGAKTESKESKESTSKKSDSTAGSDD